MEGLESFFTWSQQLHLFLLSCLFGIPLGILFDIFRVFRSIFLMERLLLPLKTFFFLEYTVFFLCALPLLRQGANSAFSILSEICSVSFCIM